MERRATRVSQAQWEILLDFLERNPGFARTRSYNNTARGRAESLRKWSEVAEMLNAEGSGTTKTPKDWSIYVSNYKSKLKKIVADINADSSATGGGPPTGGNLSEIEQRFLSLIGSGFGESVPGVAVNPLPDMNQSTAAMEPETSNTDVAPRDHEVLVFEAPELNIIDEPYVEVEVTAAPTPPPLSAQTPAAAPSPTPAAAAYVPQRRRTRQPRYRSRPLAPIEEAQRVLSQVELQRAAADRANAEANHLIARNLGRLADAIERYLSNIGGP